MKSDHSSTATIKANNPLKKLTKPFNQKDKKLNGHEPKNSTNTLVKQSSKKSLTLNTNPQGNDEEGTKKSIINKLASPKNVNLQHSSANQKTTKNIEQPSKFQKQKPDFKKSTVSTNLVKGKKPINAKVQPLKKQALSTLRSPKNGQNSQKSIVSQTKSFKSIKTQQNRTQNNENLNQEHQFANIELESSIAIQTNSKILQNDDVNHSSQQQDSKASSNKILNNKLIQAQRQQIQRLKAQKQSLQKKVQKYKDSQNQNRKLLKQKINSFNEEGQQKMALRKTIQALQKQNLELKLASNKFLSQKNMEKQEKQFETELNQNQNQQKFNLKIVELLSKVTIQPIIGQKSKQLQNTSSEQNIQKVEFGCMVSLDLEDSSLCQGAVSFTNGQCSSGCSSLISQINHQRRMSSNQQSQVNLMNALEIQNIKSSFEQKYSSEVKKLEEKYQSTLSDIEKRYKLSIQEHQETIQQQDSEITSLQKQLDQLYDKIDECTCKGQNNSLLSKSPNIETDEKQLIMIVKMNQFRQKLTEKGEEVKRLKQELRNKQLQCKKNASELDLERIKFNMKFEATNTKDKIVQINQNEQSQIIREELRQEKQKYHKVFIMNEKKDELIKKLTNQQNNKKYQGKK